MVYIKDSKFVATLIHNGKILREFKDSDGNWGFKLPFGSEYGIRFKNLNSTRVSINVEIDGEDATDGSSIVLGPNETHDLEGFFKGNAVRNKFKFIEKTEKISEHRGDKIDDGMIRISYQFEKPDPIIKKTYINTIIKNKEPWHPYDPYNPRVPWEKPIIWENQRSCDYQPLSKEVNTQGILRGNLDFSTTSKSIKKSGDTYSVNSEVKDGITVKGSQTNISYKNTYLKEMEEETHVMILKLNGYSEGKKEKISQAVTVTKKIKCETCGHGNKSYNKFCGECGTSLM